MTDATLPDVHTTEAAAVAAIATRQTDPVSRVDVPRAGGRPASACWFTRDGREVYAQDLVPTTARTVQVHTAGGMTTYCQPFAATGGDPDDGRSTLWVDADQQLLTVVLDDHANPSAPDHATHRCQMKARLHPRFEPWLKLHRQGGVSQEDLAVHLEERIADVAEPAGAVLLELARTFTATVSGRFKQAKSLHNGSTQLEWVEEVDGRAGGGQEDVPNDLTLRLPIWQGGDEVTLPAKLRYRVNSGRLTLSVHLLDIDQVMADDLAATAQGVGEALDIEVIEGVAP